MWLRAQALCRTCATRAHQDCIIQIPVNALKPPDASENQPQICGAIHPVRHDSLWQLHAIGATPALACSAFCPLAKASAELGVLPSTDIEGCIGWHTAVRMLGRAACAGVQQVLCQGSGQRIACAECKQHRRENATRPAHIRSRRG